MDLDLYRSFESFVKANQLFSEDENLIVGVSGGADSVCLLLCLNEYRKNNPVQLTVLHVNHMIRGEEADRDETYVKELCRKLDLPFVSERTNVPELAKTLGQSEEEAGRNVRYKALCKLAKEKNGCVVVAHHRDDNAETVLLNLVRGSGILGLSGMRLAGEMNGCRIVRPLLPFSREEIEVFLKERGVTWQTDSTNNETGPSRNLLRLNVLPELEKINQKAKEHICEAADQLRGIEELLQKMTGKAMEECSFRDGEDLVLRIPELKAQEPVIRKRIVLKTIGSASGSCKDITSDHVEQVLSLLLMQSGKQIRLPYQLVALRRYDEIRIRKEKPETRQEEFTIRKEELGEEEKSILLPDGRRVIFRLTDVTEENRLQLMEKNQYTKAFDYDKILGVIKVGGKVPGDEIFLKGGRKTLKKFFIDEKIPLDEREKISLLKDSESVIWIIGFRISEKHKITDDTKKACIVRIIEGERGHED